MLDFGQGFDPLLGVKITPVLFSVISKKLFVQIFIDPNAGRFTLILLASVWVHICGTYFIRHFDGTELRRAPST